MTTKLKDSVINNCLAENSSSDESCSDNEQCTISFANISKSSKMTKKKKHCNFSTPSKSKKQSSAELYVKSETINIMAEQKSTPSRKRKGQLTNSDVKPPKICQGSPAKDIQLLPKIILKKISGSDTKSTYERVLSSNSTRKQNTEFSPSPNISNIYASDDNSLSTSIAKKKLFCSGNNEVDKDMDNTNVFSPTNQTISALDSSSDLFLPKSHSKKKSKLNFGDESDTKITRNTYKVSQKVNCNSPSKAKNIDSPRKITRRTSISTSCQNTRMSTRNESPVKRSYLSLSKAKSMDSPKKRTNISSLDQNLESITPRKNKESMSLIKELNEELDTSEDENTIPNEKGVYSTPQKQLRGDSVSTLCSTYEKDDFKTNELLKSRTPQKDISLSHYTTRSEGNKKVFTPNKKEVEYSSEKHKRTPFSCSKSNENVTDLNNLSSPMQNKKITVTTPISKKKAGRDFLKPSMAKKEYKVSECEKDELDATRKQLHISTIPTSLPCRDTEFKQIKSFLLRKMEHSSGGCMYISGVPGTGKTATVHAVIRSLQQQVGEDELTDFDFVEINGLRLTEPKQAYVRIYQALTDQKLTADQAQQLLNKRFSGNCKKSTIILVDELDYLCNRRQDVVYNILDWPAKQGSALVVLTISNTMDLPERTLKGRVTSRMGLTRLVFQPYSFQQLREIVQNRLCGFNTFHPDAVQLVARKVAAVSGDARRALDICRRTTELVEAGQQVTVGMVEQALTQIFSGPRITVIQRLSGLGQLVLRSVRDVNQRTGLDETTVSQLYKHALQIARLQGCQVPTVGDVLQTCVSLVGLGLMVAEKGRLDVTRKLSLNVSSDDIHYALDNIPTC